MPHDLAYWGRETQNQRSIFKYFLSRISSRVTFGQYWVGLFAKSLLASSASGSKSSLSSESDSLKPFSSDVSSSSSSIFSILSGLLDYLSLILSLRVEEVRECELGLRSYCWVNIGAVNTPSGNDFYCSFDSSFFCNKGTACSKATFYWLSTSIARDPPLASSHEFGTI